MSALSLRLPESRGSDLVPRPHLTEAFEILTACFSGEDRDDLRRAFQRIWDIQKNRHSSSVFEKAHLRRECQRLTGPNRYMFGLHFARLMRDAGIRRATLERARRDCNTRTGVTSGLRSEADDMRRSFQNTVRDTNRTTADVNTSESLQQRRMREGLDSNGNCIWTLEDIRGGIDEEPNVLFEEMPGYAGDSLIYDPDLDPQWGHLARRSTNRRATTHVGGLEWGTTTGDFDLRENPMRSTWEPPPEPPEQYDNW